MLVKEDKTYKPLLNLEISPAFSVFKNTQIINDTVLIGWNNFFATFNLNTRKQTILSLDGYFGNFSVLEDMIFVCSASDITGLSIEGEIKWKSDPIAIDGIIINSIENNTIYCSCEWDPPGGWQPYQLDLQTGVTRKNSSY